MAFWLWAAENLTICIRVVRCFSWIYFCDIDRKKVWEKVGGSEKAKWGRKRGKDREKRKREGERIKKNYKQAGRWPVEPLLSKRLSCLWICQGTVWREAIIHLPFASDRNTAPYLNTECHWSRTASLIPPSCMHSNIQPLENLGSRGAGERKIVHHLHLSRKGLCGATIDWFILVGKVDPWKLVSSDSSDRWAID